MNLTQKTGSRSPLTGIIFSALAGLCVAAGAASLIDATDFTRDLLSLSRDAWRGVQRCPNQWSVSGWGDAPVLWVTAIALGLLVIALLVALTLPRWGGWGQAASSLAILPIALLWLDALIVSTSPIGDCDGIGLTGAASAAINHAGFLFAAAVALCLLTLAWINVRLGEVW
jgi:hypothetical protein